MEDNKRLKKILITGAAGPLASRLATLLSPEYKITGIDPRGRPTHISFPGKIHKTPYNNRKIAEIFRSDHFDILIHLGRLRPASDSSERLYKHNVLGTKNILELSKNSGIKTIIIFSTFHIYGALPTNPLHLIEEDPMRASQKFKELTDAVEIDYTASSFLWRHRDIRVVVLRPVNVIGKNLNNTISKVFQTGFCPKILGYDPLLQFIHEYDLSRALKLILNGTKSGVYNICGEGELPFSKAIELSGCLSIPIPESLCRIALSFGKRFKFTIPEYLIDYFKYPVILSDKKFREEFHFKPKFSTKDSLNDFLSLNRN